MHRVFFTTGLQPGQQALASLSWGRAAVVVVIIIYIYHTHVDVK
tara:strand:- start:1171 stop:1302 length:132 start_codon:yes stop_codon:yes gene_type:complete